MGDEKPFNKIVAEIYDYHSSEFYDYHAKRGDVQFYVDFAIKFGGKVLDIGCGTGRILLPIAREGIDITGLDNSEAMLDICRKKLAVESEAVRDKVTLVHGDMRDFEIDDTFSTAIIPFGPFNYLVSVEEHINCLNCIKQHLKDNGALIMDLWYADLRELWKSENGAEIFSEKTPFVMPDGRNVRWGIRNTSVDFNRQIIHEEMFYDIRYPDGREEQIIYPAPMRYFFRYEVEHLLARTGFRAESVYADFNRETFGSKYPSELVFIARKSDELS